MRRLLPTFAILFACAATNWAAEPAPLTTLRAIHELSNVEAARQLPVAFEATVTYSRNYERTVFVQDDGIALFVLGKEDWSLLPGDRVLIQGSTRSSFHPIVVGTEFKLLHHGALPKPLPATYDDLIAGQHDSRLITIHGVVRAADLVASPVAPVRSTSLQLLTSGGYVDVTVDSDNADALNGLLDAEVEVTGAAGGRFDDKMEMTGIVIHAPDLASIKVIRRPGADSWSLPVTPIYEIVPGYRVLDLSTRVRVEGTITYYQPGTAVVLQTGNRNLWIRTLTHNPLRIGDMGFAIGFPDVHDGFLTLARGEVRDSNTPAPITPLLVTWEQLAVNGMTPVGHHFNLVSIEGLVVMAGRGAIQDEYILVADGHPFSAIYRHPDGPLPIMKQVPLGSRVRVTGICTVDDANPFDPTVPFEILLRSFDDVVVVARPSLLNIRNLIILVGLLLAVIIVVGIRGWTLERNVRRKTSALAALESRRGRILEDINGVRPLAEILEEIAAMVSATLGGAPCWCEPADGARQGAYPQEPHSLRIVQAEIPSRAGPPLGTLYAGLNPRTPPAVREAEALHSGARLATLAIETRRLYSDLRRRSEFDLLTDIPNRFAMEKFMELQIEEARHSGRVLGLIYIDLDKFKPINDTYGHHVGDVYLQAVALRMSRQLLGGDMLARLGGDEFAAMVLLHHGRSDLEKIVARLESCFDEPFSVEGIMIHGEASIGVALFPEDGATKDNLLSAADAAMYIVKNAKRPIEMSLPQSSHS
jgi:diguanylate cyclase (GGDEF)-like protein